MRTHVDRAVVITGVAKHSLGEEIVKTIKTAFSEAAVVAIDVNPSTDLGAFDRVLTLGLDLNVFAHNETFDQFLRNKLQRAVGELGCTGIGTVIQGAALYDMGRLQDVDAGRRRALLGVNLCARLEVLCAALTINDDRGVDSATSLTYLDIGSTHGLDLK